MTLHGQIRVNVDAEVTNHCRWRHAEGTDDGTGGGQTMLATDSCAPHEHRLSAVELQNAGQNLEEKYLKVVKDCECIKLTRYTCLPLGLVSSVTLP